eukprot:TRINITY_DN11322_c0_g1_i2.p1 TRINITY_DN11322_c0_g1~~TRINITY_DN11322_c0_g1_i2.p1  ORF type:complete len:343 (+),score=90.70 TRINITY_DN11322_c0_g1_i2:74-1030(+)
MGAWLTTQRGGGSAENAAGGGGAAGGEAPTMHPGKAAREALAGRVAAADERLGASVQCAVCGKPAFRDPVQVNAPCRHMAHRHCLEGWLKEDAHCPRCKVRIPAEPYVDADPMLQEVLNNLDIKCPQDCEQPAKLVRYGDLREHLDVCPKTPVSCVSPGCAAVVLRSDLAAHRGVCLDAEVDCGQCGGTAKRRRLQRDGTGDAEQLVAAYRDRAATALGVPSTLTVSSAEQADLAGGYVLLPDVVNGRPVWGRGPRRVFAASNGFWLAAPSPESMQQGKGLLKLSATDAATPVASVRWMTWNGREFVDAPQTVVTADA